MNDISAVAVFCDDIRLEKAGTVTIVGVYPDNLRLPQIPAVLPKICVYVRMHIRPDYEPGQIVTRILMPSGQEISSNVAEPGLVQATLEKARASGALYAGLISTFTVVQLQIAQEGRLRVTVTAGDKEYVAAALNVKKLAPAATSPISS